MNVNFFPEFEQRMISNDDINGFNSPVVCQPYSVLDVKFLEYIVETSSQPNAIEELGELYHFGINGIEQNFERAFFYFKKAAEFNHPDALFMIANYYLKGIFVNKDYKLYFEYIEKAANAGSYMAWMNKATAYHFGRERYDGFGVDKNDEKCVQCNEKAIKCIEVYWEHYTKPNYRGYNALLQRLFDCYVQNIDLISQYYEPKDKQLAEIWLKKGNEFVFNACGQTHPMFDEALNKLYKS